MASPDSSPPGGSPCLFLLCPGRVHIHKPQKRQLHIPRAAVVARSAGSTAAIVVVDDDANNSPRFSAQTENSPDISMPARWSPRLQKRKRSKPLAFPTREEQIAQPTAPIVVVDDDANNSPRCTARTENSQDLSMPARWSPRLQERKRSKPLAFPTQEERILQPAALLAQLSVVELPTSGHNNNCLWFSVQRASGQLSAPSQYTGTAECQSDSGRKRIHQELLRALPPAAADVTGNNNVWWAGFNRAQAEQVYEQKLMMCEAHIFAYANMMNRPICVVDTRAHAAVIRVYRPGYAVKGLDVSMAAAQRVHATEPQCVWVRLHGVHFTALVKRVVL
jgi:hypothetical protein